MALHSLLMLQGLVLLLRVQEAAVAELVPITGTKPGCQDKCGNVSIPYPFGIGDGCSIDGGAFTVTCDDTFYPPKPYYGRLNILAISVRDGQMKVNIRLANTCDENKGITWATLGKFMTFSTTRNKFIAIGCNTIAYFGGRKSNLYYTGCVSICYSADDVSTYGSCNGIGCCQTFIPEGLNKYNVTVKSFFNKSISSYFNSFSPCSYAFLVEESWFNFNQSYLKGFNNGQLRVPVVLDWVIRKETCEEAKINSTSYACGPDTECYEPGSAPGYLCKCKPGYEGNPYLTGTGRCQDVDECMNITSPCKGLSNACINTEGNYNCICRPGYRDQRRHDGTLDCVKLNDNLLNKIIIGTSSGLLFILVSSSWLYWGFRKKKLMELKEKFFQQNGGIILQQLLKRDDEAVESTTATMIFTTEELSKATHGYDESQILGRGGYGTVYKGTMPNGKVVAIKKSKLVDRTQIEQFINEVVVLSQINHRNVVKLLGCCLETEVPLLVYEYITNGTLFQHLHDNANCVSSLSWENRLRVAVEVAGSLSYLHSAASIPIIHRDIKSSNILLDDNYTAKVSDFGASRLVPIDQTQLTTLVQGTLGYLDPEYFHTSQLTEKSDVYSFGVLLAELLTGKKALCFERPKEERNLANYFLFSVKNDHLFGILDDTLEFRGNTEQQQLIHVAELTKRCLRVKGEKRPTMKEVVMVLDGLRRSSKDPWILDAEHNDNEEERVHLLGGQGDSYIESTVGGDVTVDSQVMSSSTLYSGR